MSDTFQGIFCVREAFLRQELKETMGLESRAAIYLAVLLLACANSFASESVQSHTPETTVISDEVAHTLGVSVTYSAVAYDLTRKRISDKWYKDKTVLLNGFDVALNYYFSNRLGIEAGIYRGDTEKMRVGDASANEEQHYISLSENTDMESLSTTGGRAAVIYGYNIRDPGFMAYGGAGIYYEKTDIRQTNGGTLSDDLSSAFLKLGLGYNWQTFSLSFWLSLRGDQPEGFEAGSTQGGWCINYRHH